MHADGTFPISQTGLPGSAASEWTIIKEKLQQDCNNKLKFQQKLSGLCNIRNEVLTDVSVTVTTQPLVIQQSLIFGKMFLMKNGIFSSESKTKTK